MLTKSKNYIHYTHHLDQDGILDVVGHEALEAAKLAATGVLTPVSFVVSSLAFDDFIVAANIVDKITALLEGIDYTNEALVTSRSEQISALILQANFPTFVLNPIVQAYKSSSGFSDKYVAVKPSWVLPHELLPDNRDQLVNLNVKGEASLLYHVKKAWTSLFSPAALRSRADKDWDSGLSMAVLVQKMVQSEISGTLFTTETVSTGSDYIEIEALLGINDPELTAAFVPDIYKVDPADLKIVEKNILTQEYMVIMKGRAKPDEDHLMKVDISPEYRRKQKLDDKAIISLASMGKQLKVIYGHDLELHWGYEAGKLYIISVRPFLSPLSDLSDTIDSFATELYGSALVAEPQISYIPAQPPTEVDVPVKYTKDIDYDSLTAEVTALAEKSLPDLPEDEQPAQIRKPAISLSVRMASGTKETPNTDTPTDSAEAASADTQPHSAIDTVTQVLFDISAMDSGSLTKAKEFKGVYFDASAMLARHHQLPEALVDAKDKLASLVESYALEISTAARAIEPNPMLYMFSDLQRDLRAQLLPTTSDNLDGCERFLLHPEAMLAELAAIKRARNVYQTKNISLVLPRVRSERELLDIKKVISSQGMHRSATTKLYIEIALPVSLFELSRLRVDDIDGVIFNLAKLGQYMFGRQELVTSDYEVLINSLEQVLDDIELKNWAVGLMIPPELELIRKSFKLRPTVYIFAKRPDADALDTIQKYEREHLHRPAVRRGRKTKSL